MAEHQKQRITEKRILAMQRGWKKTHEIRMKRWAEIRNHASKEITHLSTRERWLIGIGLYWSEGVKEKEYGSATNVKFSNSDPLMILVFRNWLKEFTKVPDEKIKYELYIHKHANLKRASNFWTNKLNINPDELRIYFKPANLKPKRKNINENYNGLIRISVNGSIIVTRQISGWVEGICRNWGVV